MEKEVDSERGQVNDLVINWDSAKQEAIATREAFESEHEMRVQLEGLVPKQEQDIGILNFSSSFNSVRLKRDEGVSFANDLRLNASAYKCILCGPFCLKKKSNSKLKISSKGTENSKNFTFISSLTLPFI